MLLEGLTILIKINLIDYRKLKKVIAIQKELVIYLFLIVVGLGSIGYIRHLKVGETKEVKNDIAAWKIELIKISKVVEKVDEAKAKSDRIKQIIKSIDVLKSQQRKPAQIIDDINIMLPSETWLSNFSETDQMILLEGYSFSDPGIATFMKNLEKLSKYFKAINLVESKQVKVSGEKVRKFKIQCVRK